MKALLSGGALLLVLTGQALAFSDDRTEQLLAEHQQAVLAYAAKAGKPMPTVEDYRYGMKLDIASVVRQSGDPRTCTVTPKLMTFEDSQGRLQTIRYSAQSQCINNK
ncbi:MULTISPECIES: DUF2790 domain-containing protein [Pseudomonas]|jgi:hypothetical protein|uniref:DUF2790 domain-containing protein n=1 Tax=Pseudomonas TaxID=286 RepID=UPI000760CD8F|nr:MULTISPECIES: DUF2790 domain-containing protein [Pseudomonas]